MALDASAKRSNVRLSIKKYLVDTLEVTHSTRLFFNRGFLVPKDPPATKWVAVQFGDMQRGGLSDFIVELICATRGDVEGDELSELSDLVFDIMTDSDQLDGKRRISFFDTSEEPWVQIDSLLVYEILDSSEMDGPDNTKYQILTCKIKWVAKV